MLAVATLLVAGGCGGDEDRSTEGSLVWVGKPRVVKQPELPRDRVLIGRLRNDSLREVRLDATRARLVDEDGRKVRGTIRFIGAFARGIYSPRRAPEETPEAERRRVGELAVVRPRQTVPATLSWRLDAKGRGPTRLELGAIEVELPGR